MGRLLDLPAVRKRFTRHALALQAGAAVGLGHEPVVEHPDRAALLGAAAQGDLGGAVGAGCGGPLAHAAVAEPGHGCQRRNGEQPASQKFHEKPAVSSVPDRSISPNPAKSSPSSSSEIL